MFKIRKLSAERPRGLAICARARSSRAVQAAQRRGVQIPIDHKIVSALSRIGDGQYISAEQFTLKAEVKVVIARCLEILNHRERIEGRRSRRTRAKGGALGKTNIVSRNRRGVGRESGAASTHGCVNASPRPNVAVQHYVENAEIRLCERPNRCAGERVRVRDGPEVRDIIGQGIAAANRQPSVSKGVPGETNPRSEIVEIEIVK